MKQLPQPSLSRKERIVAIAFRLFIGGVVVLRLVSWFTSPDHDDLDHFSHARQFEHKLDAVVASLDSAEAGRRAYDLTHDFSYLRVARQNAQTVTSRFEALRQLTSRPAESDAVDHLEEASQEWLIALSDGRVHRPQRPRVVIDAVCQLRRLQREAIPFTKRELAEQVLSSKLGALLLTLVEMCALLLANMVFHQQMEMRVRVEEKLRRREQFARSTVDALSTHIAILDCNGVIMATNQAWRDFAEANGADLARVGEGVNYLIVCDGADGKNCQEAARFAAGIRAVLAGKQDEFTIEYAAHSVKERRWFVGRVTRFPGPVSQVEARYVPRLVVSHENITARKLAEEALQHAKEQAEMASLAKSAFLANTSHELRTPMTAILGYSEMMLDANQTPADRRQAVQTIRRNGEHLLSIINDLLDISKIEAQKVTVEKLKFSLPQLVADVIGLTRPWAIKKGLRYDVDFIGEIPKTIETDPLRSKQVLVNLISNAIKFTEKGGIKIRIRREVSFFNHMIHFEVIDSGIGMTPEQVKKLFQPFTQADASTTRRFGGTGLGLTISQRLSKLLGGDILVESTPSAGSTFTFFFDGGPRQGIETLRGLTVDQLTVGADEQFIEDSCVLQGRVLLAEDGEDNQLLLSTHLRKAGAEVVLAVNGREAVNEIRRQNFDLILMDMQMPEMDGYTAARTLRESGCDLPIIALTANAMAEDRTKCIQAGCTEYLSKPVSRAQLLIAVSRFLKKAPDPIEGAAPVSAKAASPQASGVSATIHSTFKEEPTVKRLLEKFIERLPDRVNTMAGLLQQRNVDALRQAVHQLKGAGGGYGFPLITEAAGEVEDRLRVEADVEAIRQDVLRLIDVVRSVEGYDRTREQMPTVTSTRK